MKKKYQLYLLLVVSFGLTFGWQITGSASDPVGVKLTNVFNETKTFANSDENSAHVTEQISSDGTKYDVVNVTSAPNQVGAIWSDEKYKFNLMEEMKASMWLNFGNNPKNAGDGMAFVLQNAGPNVIADIKNRNADNRVGQSLGVWGNGSYNDLGKIAGSAIQKSWALEFDTYLNQNGDLVSGFDKDVSNQNKNASHIATGYPGDVRTYKKNTNTILGILVNKEYYSMIHNHPAVLTHSLSDGSWYHLELKWTPPAAMNEIGKMDYSLTKKGAANPEVHKTADVDTKAFGQDVHQVYWGFTGSTGTRYENAKIIFEKMPKLAEVSPKVTLQNETTNEAINSKNNLLMNGDKLQYQYELTYNNGKQSWDGVHAKLPIFNLDDVVITEVYDDGTNTTTHKPSVDKDSDGYASFKLSEALSKNQYNHVVITVSGTVKKSINNHSDPKPIAEFKAPNYQTTLDLDALRYQVLSPANLTIKSESATPLEVFTNAHSQALIAVNYQDGLTGNDIQEKVKKLHWRELDKSDITHSVSIDGSNPDAISANWHSVNAKNPVQLSIDFAGGKLSKGPHRYAIWLEDEAQNLVSNRCILEVNVMEPGSLSLSVNPKINIGTFQLTGKTYQRPLEGVEFDLQVHDDRNGKQKDWKLQAQSSSFGDNVNSPAAVLRFNNTDMFHNVLIDIDIGLGSKSISDAQLNSDKGFSLKVFANAPAKQYSTTITWTLVNSVS